MKQKNGLDSQIVYLAGPMSGMTIEESEAWRTKAAEYLGNIKDPDTNLPMYHVISPLRGKAFLRGSGPLVPVDNKGIGWDQWIYRRDKWDVERADVVLVNLTDAVEVGKVSIGTVFEIAWASDKGKFVLVVMDNKNPHYHAFVKQAASLVVSTLDEALHYMGTVLNQTGGGT